MNSYGAAAAGKFLLPLLACDAMFFAISYFGTIYISGIPYIIRNGEAKTAADAPDFPADLRRHVIISTFLQNTVDNARYMRYSVCIKRR